MILDASPLSALADEDPEAIARIRDASILAIPVVVLGEFRFGVSQSRRSGEYECWLKEFLPSCRILDITSDTTVSYALIRVELKRVGRPIPSNDVWIAAHSVASMHCPCSAVTGTSTGSAAFAGSVGRISAPS